MSEVPVDTDFPVWGLLPKKETGAYSFLSKYPNYDGRGTVIAVLDSGIDPGAPGLQKTSDGKVKVIERFDCSGFGDVNTKTIVKPDDGYITGLTGRKLKIPTDWKNPEGTYRVGVKNAFDLYPDRLKDRMKAEHKRKQWDEAQRKIVSNVNRDISEFESKVQGTTLSDTNKLEKEDLDAKLEILTNLDKKYNDLGPVFDCILFHDGEKWMCCINNRTDNNLSQCPLLGEYSITHQYQPLTKEDSLNISINVHENGDILELVGICSSHGTHVASIASAYFPDSPEENGVAPGAQVISLTIGDGRLGSMETGTALIRAMIKLIELKKTINIQIINMSYGEHAHWVDSGRVGDLVSEVVNKYGITWISSAGNNGPALGTISTPSDTINEPIISVGAYVSPEMMIAEYAMRQKLPGSPYTWSSRGPTIDGGVGVHVCAPGGAITSVPNFTLRYSQLMNGTSMASPNCAGVVSLLVSGLINQGVPYSPYILRKALENTASFIEGVEISAQGSGLVQVDKAFDYLIKYHDVPERDVRFHLQCGSSNAKGIYLRTKLHTHTHTFKISVEPQFLNDEIVPAETKINFNLKLVLTCNESSFIEYPKNLDLANVARQFAIKIDTSSLQEGLYSTFINAYDVSNIAKGPVFKIPITIIIPKEINDPRNMVIYKKVPFKPNTIKRHYYVVPNRATWAVLKLYSNEDSGRYAIHTLQCLPRQHCKAMETNKIVAVSTKSETLVTFPVKGENVLEVVIAKYWANIGEASLDYTISFYGVHANQPHIHMHAADGIHTVDVNTLQGEEISPVITLKNSVQILKPTDAKISPLTARDVIPPHRQIYELILTYNFSLTKQAEVSPNFALLSGMLYESEYESQLWMLYDSNKQLLGCGDAYPSKYSVKLEKGDYNILLQVRHDKKEYLEKLNDAMLLLQQKLNNSITMDVYLSYTQALIGGKKAGITHNSNPHSTLPLYITPLAADKFQPKANNAAHYLTGYITYAKDELGKKVDMYPVKYILSDQVTKKSPTNGATSPEKTKNEEYTEAVRDIKTNWLSKLGKENGEKLYEELENEFPLHLQIHSSYLQLIDPLDKRILPNFNQKPTSSIEDLNKVITVCNKVIQNVNEESVLAYIATKTDLRSDAAKHKTLMEQQKNVYLECLARKGLALCRLKLLTDDETHLQSISDVWKSLLKFVDPSDAKVLTSHVLYMAIWHSFVYKQYGRLLKYIFKLQEDKPSEETEKKIMEICVELRWTHVAQYFERLLPSKFPGNYKPF